MTVENTKTAQFDPGYAPLVVNSLGQAGVAYYMFSAAKDIKFKKLNFPHTLRKIETYLKTDASFYLGCMLWASYLKSLDNYIIEGNQLLGEKCEEKEYVGEIDFLIDLVENQLNRDSKYFLNKQYESDKRYSPIFRAYKDFLILNKGFCDCSNTNQIILPEYLKKINDSNSLKEKIQNAIQNKNIESILDLYDILF